MEYASNQDPEGLKSSKLKGDHMKKIEMVKGTLRVFWELVKEDFHYMDHKLLRIVGGIIFLLLIAYLWSFISKFSIP